MGEEPATDEGVLSAVEAGDEFAAGTVRPIVLAVEDVREGAGPGFFVKKPFKVDCFLSRYQNRGATSGQIR